MAYKTFANGFPLPASDLNNFLMNQSVIVFADAAARGTAIPSPVQGMLTYLVDTAAYESWNGSAFVSISNPGDITAVTAGTGLTGGGTSGDVTLNLDTAAVIPSSTVTTAQDLIVADGASSVTRLGVGANDQVLSVVAGSVAWADAGGGGGMELLSTTTLSGAYTEVTSISQDYQTLIVEVQDMDYSGGYENFPQPLRIRINGGTTFQNMLLISSGSNSSTVQISARNNIGFDSDKKVKATEDSLFRCIIPNYSDTTKFKFATTQGFFTDGDGTDKRWSYAESVYSSNTAISVIQVRTNDATFDGGTLRIYGAN